MAYNSPSACLKIAACVCAKDGVISQVEETTIQKILVGRFPDFGNDQFELAMDEFFGSNKQIEDYLAMIDDSALREFTLELAESSAAADGLDPRENIALEKAYTIWRMSRHA